MCQTNSKFCRVCNDLLVPGDNWSHTSVKNSRRYCDTCGPKADAARYIADRESINKRTRERAAETTAWMRAIKKESGCVDCGYNAHPSALDFDHIGDDKHFDIGSNTSASRERLQAEMDKCEVVCANCHRIRTYKRRKGETLC
jgi:DNA-directed RNA polymerase subunit M/transcription elongation factor TFIIS